MDKNWVVETMEQEPQLRYLMLKATHARLCVFMDVDARLFEQRKHAREKVRPRIRTCSQRVCAWWDLFGAGRGGGGGGIQGLRDNFMT